MDSPHTPPQQQQQQQQQQGQRSIRPKPSNLSTSSFDSATSLIASPLSSFRQGGGASAYQQIADISEDDMNYKGTGPEREQPKSPSPQHHRAPSPLSPSLGSGNFAGHRPQGLGVRYNSGAVKVVRHAPPPVSRGNASPASPEAGGDGAGGFFRGLESHLEEEEEEEEREKYYKGHKRATSFGTLDSGKQAILLYCPSFPPSFFFC